MAASTRRLLADENGTAMLEALICLPVFAASLAAVVALNGMYGAKLEAKSRARRMAWLQADSGECPAQACRSGECGRIEGEIRAGGLDDLLTVQDGRFSLDSFVGNLGRFFLGQTTNGIGVAEALMPTMLSPEMGSQHGVTTLLCNTRARNVEGGGNVLEHACRAGLQTTEYAREVCK